MISGEYLPEALDCQEETTALCVPCVTLRKNTERPITIEMGTNVLGGTGKALKAYRESMEKLGGWEAGRQGAGSGELTHFSPKHFWSADFADYTD